MAKNSAGQDSMSFNINVLQIYSVKLDQLNKLLFKSVESVTVTGRIVLIYNLSSIDSLELPVKLTLLKQTTGEIIINSLITKSDGSFSFSYNPISSNDFGNFQMNAQNPSDTNKFIAQISWSYLYISLKPSYISLNGIVKQDLQSTFTINNPNSVRLSNIKWSTNDTVSLIIVNLNSSLSCNQSCVIVNAIDSQQTVNMMLYVSSSVFVQRKVLIHYKNRYMRDGQIFYQY